MYSFLPHRPRNLICERFDEIGKCAALTSLDEGFDRHSGNQTQIIHILGVTQLRKRCIFVVIIRQFRIPIRLGLGFDVDPRATVADRATSARPTGRWRGHAASSPLFRQRPTKGASGASSQRPSTRARTY